MRVTAVFRLTACWGIITLSLTNVVLADEVKISNGSYTLNGDLVIADGQQRSDRIVLIVHGTLGHKDMDLIETLQEAFFEAGQNSLAINLSLNIDDRHGFFPCDALHTHRSSDALTEIEAWTDWLAGQGAGDVVLMGHSRGANQVARYVARDAGNMAAAVLLAPISDVAPAAQSVLQGTETGLFDGVLNGISFLHCDAAEVTSSAYLSYYGANAESDTVPVIEKTRVPTLVISGSEDEVATGLAARLAEVSNSLVTHHEIAGAGHFFRDLYAYDVVDSVTEFLTRPVEARPIALALMLQDDGKQSLASGQPIVVFISQKNCEYCQLLRRRILFPMIRAGLFSGKAILREVSLDPGFNTGDFDGAEVAGRVFAARYNVYVTPTLLFLNSRGESVAAAIVGTSNIDYYEFYLNRAIDEAAKALRH